MEISVRQQDGVICWKSTDGSPSANTAEQLNEALQSIVQRGGRKVVINLNGVPQIDSSGISSWCASPFSSRGKAARSSRLRPRTRPRLPHRHSPGRSHPDVRLRLRAAASFA